MTLFLKYKLDNALHLNYCDKPEFKNSCKSSFQFMKSLLGKYFSF